MKNVLFGLFLVILSSCALPVTYVYDMNWSCNANTACERSLGSWNGSGQFQNETDCLAWETAFINTYTNVSVTSCTQTPSN